MIRNGQMFDEIQVGKLPVTTFDLTHDHKLTCRMGELVPILNMEMLPGDVINISSDVLVRFQPLIAPVMHRFDVFIHYWFVPYRLLWDHWDEFISMQSTGGIPQFLKDGTWGATENRLGDYLGAIPFVAPNATTPTNICALHFAAYQKVYDDVYRDENLISPVWSLLADGVNARGTFCQMRKRAWAHDYFTSSLPTPQFNAAVSIPLGDPRLKTSWSGKPFWQDNVGTQQSGQILNVTAIPSSTSIHPPVGADTTNVAYDPQGTLEVAPTTINTLRRAFALQEFLEALMRGGRRFTEVMLGVWGVRSQDARLQRPEYITGTQGPVIISEVLNTGGQAGGANVPQGNMAGHAVSVGNGFNGRYYIPEHGVVLGILSVMPKPAYQQMLPKHFTKVDPLEFGVPMLSHVGEVPVRNDEIFAYGPNPTGTFGYLPIFTEYRYLPNRVSGQFRTSLLNFWGAQRIFTNQPTLSQTFIECTSDDYNRIFAVNTSDDNLIIQVLNKITCKRQLPDYGTPRI